MKILSGIAGVIYFAVMLLLAIYFMSKIDLTPFVFGHPKQPPPEIKPITHQQAQEILKLYKEQEVKKP